MGRRLAHHVWLYWRLQSVHLRSQLEYEADLWVGIIGVFLIQLSGALFVWTLYSRLPEILGWTLWEAAFLYSLLILPRGLADLLCDGPWNLTGLVNRGGLERLLVRPAPLLLQLVAQSSRMHGLGHFLLGGMVLGYASYALGFAWTPGRVLFLGLTLVCSVIILGALCLASNCIAFWDRSGDVRVPALVMGLGDIPQVPLSVYDRIVQGLVTWVLPFAFVSYFPACALLDKPLPWPWLAWLAPVMALGSTFLAALLWRLGLSRYETTGN